jgi:hypothetical protein
VDRQTRLGVGGESVLKEKPAFLGLLDPRRIYCLVVKISMDAEVSPTGRRSPPPVEIGKTANPHHKKGKKPEKGGAFWYFLKPRQGQLLSSFRWLFPKRLVNIQDKFSILLSGFVFWVHF